MKFNCITSTCFKQTSDQAQEAINFCYIKASVRRQDRIKKEIIGQVVDENERMNERDETRRDETRPDQTIAGYMKREKEKRLEKGR